MAMLGLIMLAGVPNTARSEELAAEDEENGEDVAEAEAAAEAEVGLREYEPTLGKGPEAFRVKPPNPSPNPGVGPENRGGEGASAGREGEDRRMGGSAAETTLLFVLFSPPCSI